MKTVKIEGTKRTALGKKDTKKLRDNNLIPCVIYGGDVEPAHISIKAADFRKVIYTPNVYLIDLEVEGKKIEATIQDIQYHPVDDKVLHVDFLRIDENKPIKIEIPVKLKGYAAGLKAGGKVNQNLRKVKTKGLAKNMPDNLTLNIENLEIGQSIKIEDLDFENLEFLNPKAVPVVSIVVTRAVATEEVATAAVGEGEAAAEVVAATTPEAGAKDAGEKKAEKK
ncbi:MAG: 50S ribosomal protein L25/general stress protein Ctc [Prolixibacteraceae bacterium]|nr:50S ribosomal protein L25/general stress protein Ctc [Prolixibacteraceae bacterium]